MGTLQQGAFQAVRNCMGIKKNEKVVIITDKATLEIAKALEKESKKITDNVKLFVLEDYGKRPLKKLPDEIKEPVINSDVSFLAVQKAGNEKVDEGSTIRRPVRELAFKHKSRIAAMPGINRAIMQQAMCVDQNLIRKISKKVYSIVKKAKVIRVTTFAGTDVTFEFSKAMKWSNNDGDFRTLPQTSANIPSSEVYTCPKNTNGTLVVDGCIGSYFTTKYGLLKDLVVIDVANNKAINIFCKNKELEQDLKNYIFKTDSNSSKVGEIGIGTNIGVKKLIGVMLQDEKFPGIHVAFGNPYPEITNAKWASKAHIDLVLRRCSIYVDNKMIMKDGKFII